MASDAGSRALDVLLAAIALTGLSPALALAASAILIDDGPPILFRQARVGRGGVPFSILKLRTMREGRVTPAGAWLRATGLDELPQFVNVLRGEMSVVGPRPLTASDVERLALGNDRFGVRPGITGLAQLFGGRGLRHSRRLERLQIARKSARLDLELVSWSFVVNLIGKARARRVLAMVRRASFARRRAARGRVATDRSPSTAVRPFEGTPA
jgi:lipopolysaccharide/colanic/teichoic acid biosynthesis glycosyltransferase